MSSTKSGVTARRDRRRARRACCCCGHDWIKSAHAQGGGEGTEGRGRENENSACFVLLLGKGNPQTLLRFHHARVRGRLRFRPEAQRLRHSSARSGEGKGTAQAGCQGGGVENGLEILFGKG